MTARDLFTRIEKRLERLADRTDVALQPIEIRKRIVDEVEALVEPTGRSSRVLAFNWIGVRLGAPDDQRRAALEAVLETGGGLQAAIESRLREIDCPVPPGLVVEVRFVEQATAGSAVPPYTLLFERRVRGRSPEAPSQAAGWAGVATGNRDSAAPMRARLVVVKGDAAEETCIVGAGRTNVGRLAEVEDKDHRIIRRNQLVFLDIESRLNQTVSRAQAHVEFAPPDEYRLFDDRSTYGTRIFRQGRTIEIPSGSPKGVRLEHLDEIYFGQACVRFEIDRD